MFDDIASTNRDRWNALATAGIGFSVPALDLNEQSAREMVDPEHILGDLRGLDVLCLAAGGGQQSAAFSLLGANATVLELSEVQLERDRQAAAHYGYSVRCEIGDMRDLSRFTKHSFDLVWQAHSLNFVPHPQTVFAQVSHVLRTGGQYRVEFTNPFIHGTWAKSWTGTGYLIAPYADAEVDPEGDEWDFTDPNGIERKLTGPREFRHTLGTVVNGLVAEHLQIRGLWEDTRGDANAEPGSWKHFKALTAPWITILAQRG